MFYRSQCAGEPMNIVGEIILRQDEPVPGEDTTCPMGGV